MTRLFALALVALALTAQNAAAANPVDVLVDSGAVDLSTGSDGSHSAAIVVSDVRTTPVVVQGSLVGQPGCTVKADPAAVNPGNRTKVTLTLDASCTVSTPAAIRLTFGPHATPASVMVTAKPPPGDPRWSIVAKSFGIAFLAALAVTGLVRRRTRKIKLSTELKGLGTNWSFKENWLGNVTVGATVLVALLASSDTFEAVIGPSAKSALTAMTVAAAVASVFVGLAPLIVKFIGKDLSYATVLGMLLAAFVTLFGTIGQVTALTWEAWAATSGNQWIQVGAGAIGAFAGLIVLLYAVLSLEFLVKHYSRVDPPPRPDALKAADIVAAAIEGQRRMADALAAANRAATAAASAPQDQQTAAAEDVRKAREAAEQTAATVREHLQSLAEASVDSEVTTSLRTALI